MEDKVMTAVKAIIKVDGVAIGQMKSIRATENIQRGDVRGLGNMISQELPALGITCTFNCDFYCINLKRSGIPGLDPKSANSIEVYANSLMLGRKPVDVYIYKKDANVTSGQLIVEEIEEEDFAIIRDLHLESSSFDITEGQISGRNQSGRYLSPILLPV